jgi:hypothetical protein
MSIFKNDVTEFDFYVDSRVVEFCTIDVELDWIKIISDIVDDVWNEFEEKALIRCVEMTSFKESRNKERIREDLRRRE